MEISMFKITQPLGRLIFNMGIAMPGKTVFLIDTAPGWRVAETKYDMERVILMVVETYFHAPAHEFQNVIWPQPVRKCKQ